MRNCEQKPTKCYVCAAESPRCGELSRGWCVILALLIGLVLCDPATARPQFGGESFGGGNFGGGNQNRNPVPVGIPGATGKMWNSVSQAAFRAEVILRHPPSAELREAETFAHAAKVLQSMGLDVLLTTSASDDALAPDEPWEVIGNSNETGSVLGRYLTSCNAVFSVTQKGAIEIISRDEMYDERYFQTVVYRVDNLVSNEVELKSLAVQIQETLSPEDWDLHAGSATIQPRIQSGHPLLLVSNHYQSHVMLRQFLCDLSAVSGSSVRWSGAAVAERGGRFRESGSRLIDVPDQPSHNLGGSVVLDVPQTMQSGGMF